ncbi:hypothetical protein SELMODRAFT_408487 [Selaginella moellendorffii]|uniref:Uncharacterized protein n=1 Tax=Selaginella moellendorffii TaxID=88036 RepID=D8R8G9_SELML|nr:hypothetical protein SELMODRAFT_408487 [Selaginella moellendorffii]
MVPLKLFDDTSMVVVMVKKPPTSFWGRTERPVCCLVEQLASEFLLVRPGFAVWDGSTEMVEGQAEYVHVDEATQLIWQASSQLFSAQVHEGETIGAVFDVKASAVQQVSQVFKSSGKLSTERIAEVHKGCSIGDARWKAARLLQRLRTNSLGENKLLRIVPWSSFLCAKNAFQSCTVGGMLPDSWFLATAPRQAFAGSGDLQWSTCPGRVNALQVWKFAKTVHATTESSIQIRVTEMERSNRVIATHHSRPAARIVAIVLPVT